MYRMPNSPQHHLKDARAERHVDRAALWSRRDQCCVLVSAAVDVGIATQGHKRALSRCTTRRPARPRRFKFP